ncbi:conserved Plasmodium protein, unknown function [Plasmodium vivax]|uniref:Uncharacterized protein n=5 Tax=Plasmodium vivax TaxID=5855 RepID=A5K1P7_PLAVS|nr:hypothetical protein, conserved [Plasmodium vivax]KMZ79405.1 hypothetical protein PVIIG_04081 [Plasmodium vivax India VII]KMZ92265.1 hypothetical protein PVMG_02253 [Plasmodium vivax Mauritania I]KMZ98499.1 hypothetical protein PVNG_04642 [Plasmodium vivax North Korean]EDL46347.1 hypothetical protein, conserved [Plasmodium vivax]CAG9478199.1 unnamed protein product [Plasmodium vivax]|eukprot:XP_001616074.1 hypothetical protein [Plasmodium vivax Sal-1]
MDKLKNLLFVKNGNFSNAQIKLLAFTSLSMLVLMVTGDGLQTPLGYIRNVKRDLQKEAQESEESMEKKLLNELGHTTYHEWKKAGIIPSDDEKK